METKKTPEVSRVSKAPKGETAPAAERAPGALRDRILNHAAGRFMLEGFSGVTMDRIASELGLSKKTLYSHFPGKQDLLMAAIRRQLEGLKRRLDEAFEARGLHFTDRLDRLMRAVASQLTAVRFPLIDDLYRHAPRVWQEIDEFRKTYVFDRLEQLLRQGIREGYVRSDLNPHLVVFIIRQVAQSGLNPAQMVELGVLPAEVLAAVTSLVYHGVFTDRGRRQMEPLRGGGQQDLRGSGKHDRRSSVDA